MPEAEKKPKTSADFKAEYDALVKKVQAAAADGVKLEKKLLDEVKVKVKAYAGDFDKLKEQKRAAHIAYESSLASEAAAKKPPETPATPVLPAK